MPCILWRQISAHSKAERLFLFTGLENLRIFQTCLFTRGVERESFSYKSNLLRKRRSKKGGCTQLRSRLLKSGFLLYGMFGFSSLCIVLGKQGVQVVLVLAVAEVAHYLTVGVLVPHTHKLCTAKAE